MWASASMGVREGRGVHVRGLHRGSGDGAHGVASVHIVGHGGGPRSNLGRRIGLLRKLVAS